MPQTIGRKHRRTWLPPHPDAAAEFAVPEPAPEAREAPGRRTVWKSDGRTLSFAVFHAGEKRRCIGLNAREFFACGLDTALVVGRPPTLERSDVARKVFWAGTHELHTRRLTRRRRATQQFENQHAHHRKLTTKWLGWRHRPVRALRSRPNLNELQRHSRQRLR